MLGVNLGITTAGFRGGLADAADGGTAPTSFFLLEDGTSKIVLESSSGFLGLEGS